MQVEEATGKKPAVEVCAVLDMEINGTQCIAWSNPLLSEW